MTSTVSRCRVTGSDEGMIAVNWVCSDEGRLGVPLLTLVPLLSVGTLWGQPWGHDLRAGVIANALSLMLRSGPLDESWGQRRGLAVTAHCGGLSENAARSGLL